MNEQVLSSRLMEVGKYVPQGARLADIGSDHAYLPTYLMLKEKISFAVAGEVVRGPYESAKKQVAKNRLEDKLVVRLADGLAAVRPEDQIDAITIAGMGGALIRTILENGKTQGQLTGKEVLILQPNVGEATLRRWLVENQYAIVHEEILEENHKIYEIIVAQLSENVSYTAQELFFGPKLLQDRQPIFLKKWQKELASKERVLRELMKAQEVPLEKVEEVKEQLSWIREVIA
ncbi:tRNA (adenine(22)-N(1))-methyltransferase [Enterococcus sp. LJL98]